MDNKKNQLGFGIILLLLGVLYLFQSAIVLNAHIISLFAGAALMFLYILKKKTWALMLAGYLLLYGAGGILFGFFFPGRRFVNASAVMMLAPAFILFVFYFQRKRYGYLLPASIFLWVGIHTAFAGLIDSIMPGLSQHFRAICAGSGFIMFYILRRAEYLSSGRERKQSTLPLIIGIAILGLSLLPSIGYSFFDFSFRDAAAIVLFGFGAVLVLKSINRKKKG